MVPGEWLPGVICDHQLKIACGGDVLAIVENLFSEVKRFGGQVPSRLCIGVWSVEYCSGEVRCFCKFAGMVC